MAMVADRRNRLVEIRKRLATLTPEEKGILAAKGMVATVEGRPLSLYNTIMVYLQSPGRTPTIVGGYQQWHRAGKQVRKGEHGSTILFPVGPKDNDGEIVEAERFYAGTIFDISQTEDITS